MADTIMLKGGNKAGMPRLNDREPAYCRDENAFYIGTPDGNKRVGGEKVEAQEPLDSEADTYALVDAFNSLLEAMKTAGLMEN